MYFHGRDDLKQRELAPGIIARLAWGERITMSFVTLGANSVLPAHAHPHEQMGTVLRGSLEVTIGDETKTVREGDVYLIPSDIRHSARTGPEQASVLDIFSPRREDYM